MRYLVYRDKPKGSNVPLLGDKWECVGSVERDCEPRDVSWSSAVKEVTGRDAMTENDMGIWYMVLPEGSRP